MAVNRCSPATLSLVRPCEETMAERTVLRRPEPLPTLPGPSSAVRDHPRLRAGKKAAPVKLTDCVAGTETQALPPAAPIPPASGAAVRPRSPARPGQLGRRHCLLFHPATRRGAPGPLAAPASGGWKPMCPKSSQRGLTMAALGTERGLPSSGARRKKGWQAARADGGAPPWPPGRRARGPSLATCWWEVRGPALRNRRGERAVSSQRRAHASSEAPASVRDAGSGETSRTNALPSSRLQSARWALIRTSQGREGTLQIVRVSKANAVMLF